jgi:hypothetical protein
MQLCLFEASRVVVRVALREIELSELEGSIEESVVEKMRRFAANPMGES